MTNNEKLKSLAQEKGYEVITITSGMNGYPSHLRPAVTGFLSIEDAQEFADAVGGCNILSLHQRVGWQFWEDQGSFTITEPYDMMDLYEDNGYIKSYLSEDYASEEDFIEDEDIKYDINDIDNFDDMIKFLQHKKALWAAIENAEDDEIVLDYLESNEIETIKRYVMSYQEDSHNYTIAVVPMAL